MSTTEILDLLPRLSLEEREIIASFLRELKNGYVMALPVFQRQGGLHTGSWEVNEDFDEALSEEFWLNGHHDVA